MQMAGKHLRHLFCKHKNILTVATSLETSTLATHYACHNRLNVVKIKTGEKYVSFPLSSREFLPVHEYIKTDKGRVNARVRPGTWGCWVLGGVGDVGGEASARFRNTNVINGF